MAEERGTEFYRANDGDVRSRDTASYGSSGKSIASAVAEQQQQSQSRLAAAAARAKKKSPMPKQEEGESPAAFADKMRIWRASE